MPYVIRNDRAQFLRLYPHRYTKKREWVSEVDQATIWTEKGSAKLAMNQAAALKPTALQEVRLMLWGMPESHKPKKVS